MAEGGSGHLPNLTMDEVSVAAVAAVARARELLLRDEGMEPFVPVQHAADNHRPSTTDAYRPLTTMADISELRCDDGPWQPLAGSFDVPNACDIESRARPASQPGSRQLTEYSRSVSSISSTPSLRPSSPIPPGPNAMIAKLREAAAAASEAAEALHLQHASLRATAESKESAERQVAQLEAKVRALQQPAPSQRPGRRAAWCKCRLRWLVCR